MSHDTDNAPPPATPPSIPEPPRKSLDEARAAVAGLAAQAIANAADALRAQLAEADDVTTVAYQNGMVMLRAADEFVLGAKATIRTLTRPRILRPDRGIKVVGKLQ